MLLHAAALALGPQMRQARIEPARILSVVLTEVPAPRVEDAVAPPAPAAMPREERRPERPQRSATPKPLARAEPEARPAAPLAPPAESAAPAAREEVRASEPAPSAPPTVAARAAVSPPDYRAAYLNNPAPPYPRAARRSGDQGTVTLRVRVSTEGAPAQVELDRSSGSNILDAAALEAVKRWRFAPARRGSEPIEAWVIVPVVFRLAPDA
jgi:protein TonB